MRYCIRCGSTLENGSVCAKCGTDNAINEKKDGNSDTADVMAPQAKAAARRVRQYGQNGAGTHRRGGESGFLKNAVPAILHWAAILLFALTALAMLRNTFADGTVRVNDVMISQENVLFVIVYFAAGLWSVISAVLFLLNGNKIRNDGVIIAAFTVLFFLILSFLSNAAADYLPEGLKILPSVLESYRDLAYQTVILAVLSITAGIAGGRQAEKAAEI